MKKAFVKPRAEREFDPTKYSTRLVAFKLAYLGKRYNGFEYHKGNWTPLPTIEEELWKAFSKARLISPGGANPLEPGEVNWEGTDYTKCGRTDKGVSAFGQVIGIRIRSNRPLRKREQKQKVDEEIEIEGVRNMMEEGFKGKEDLIRGSFRSHCLEPPWQGKSIGNVEGLDIYVSEHQRPKEVGTEGQAQ